MAAPVSSRVDGGARELLLELARAQQHDLSGHALFSRLVDGVEAQDGKAIGRVVADAKGEAPEIKRALAGVVAGAVEARKIELDPAALQILRAYAGESSTTDGTVRMETLAPVVTEASGGEAATNRFLANEEGRARSQRRDPTQHLTGGRKHKGSTSSAAKDADVAIGRSKSTMREVSEGKAPPSALEPVLAEAGDCIRTATSQAATQLLDNPTVQTALAKCLVQGVSGGSAAAVKPLLKELGTTVGNELCATMGLKFVNEAVVKEGLALLPQAMKSVGVKGGEALAQKVGGVLLQEGAEVAVKEGAKAGAAAGVKGLVGAIPIANMVPLLITGGQLLHEFTKPEKDWRAIIKGLGVAALQVGACAFPPLGLVAAAVDVGGSMYIAASDAKAQGGDREAMQDAAQRARVDHGQTVETRQDSIQRSAASAEDVLGSLATTFDELGATERGVLARELAGRAGKISRGESVDEAEARAFDQDVRKFSVEHMLAEIAAQAEKAKDPGGEHAAEWKLAREGLDDVLGATALYRSRGDSGPLREDRAALMIGSFLRGLVKMHAASKAADAGAAADGDSSKPSEARSSSADAVA